MERMAFRPSIAELCVGVPPLVFGIAIAGILILAAFGVHPLWPDMALTTAEAAALGDDSGFVRLVLAGADPNAPAKARAGVVAPSEQVLTPLEAAVRSQEERMLRTVLKYGAAIDRDNAERAVCTAHRAAPQLLPLLYSHGARAIDPGVCDPEAP